MPSFLKNPIVTLSLTLKAFENGFIFETGRMMHDYAWEMIARTMDHFDTLAEK
jgi:hypothetical protein